MSHWAEKGPMFRFGEDRRGDEPIDEKMFEVALTGRYGLWGIEDIAQRLFLRYGLNHQGP
jgi:hypothetical protein